MYCPSGPAGPGRAEPEHAGLRLSHAAGLPAGTGTGRPARISSSTSSQPRRMQQRNAANVWRRGCCTLREEGSSGGGGHWQAMWAARLAPASTCERHGDNGAAEESSLGELGV
jgi:hypothetical protein